MVGPFCEIVSVGFRNVEQNHYISGFEDVFKLFLQRLSMFEFDCRCYAFVLNVVFHCNFSLKLNNQICIYWYHANGMGSN